jgi:hypothetical protein
MKPLEMTAKVDLWFVAGFRHHVPLDGEVLDPSSGCGIRNSPSTLLCNSLGVISTSFAASDSSAVKRIDNAVT